jgi:hypothetical protein
LIFSLHNSAFSRSRFFVYPCQLPVLICAVWADSSVIPAPVSLFLQTTLRAQGLNPSLFKRHWENDILNSTGNL